MRLMSDVPISARERFEVDEVATKAGTFVSPWIPTYLLWLPIIKKLLERIETLERQIK